MNSMKKKMQDNEFASKNITFPWQRYYKMKIVIIGCFVNAPEQFIKPFSRLSCRNDSKISDILLL